MTYAYPENISKFSDIIVWASTVTGNWFGIGTLLLLFGIVFISTVQFGAKKAFALSSWLTLFLSFGWFILGVASGRDVFIVLVFVAIAMVSLYMDKD